MKLRRIALFLAMIMAITSFAIIPANAAGAGIGGEEKYEILCRLGFFDESAKYAEKVSVTRGEIITALINAMPEDKLPVLGAGKETGFSDVSVNDPLAEIAYAASELNLLGEQEELKASISASTDDALFIMLNLLGYNSVAGDNSSAFAASIGLTKGVAAGAKCSMSSLVSMIYNALDTEILQQVYEKGGIVKKTVSGETYMSEILMVKKLRGQVTAGKNAAVMGETPTHKNSVVINGTEYKNGKIAADEFLGCVVDYYFRVDEEAGDHELLYVKIADENDVTHIEADRIRKFENMTYTYEPGESVTRTKTAKISVETEIIYNGKNITDVPANFRPESGYVRLIDNDGDRVNEIAIIMDFVSVTVGGTDLDTGEIYDFYYPERSYKIDLYDDVVNYDIKTAKGTYARFGDIGKMDTIFIAQSQDKELVTIIVSKECVMGTVSVYNEEEIVIDGFTYEPTADLRAKSNVGVRSYGIFHLDPAGRVASYESRGEQGLKAGYITKIIYDPDVDSVFIAMFTEDGVFSRFYTAEKWYYVDGREVNPTRTQVFDAEGMVGTLNAAKDTEIGGGLFMLYKLNSNGEIKELEIPAEYTTNLERSEELNDNAIFRKYTNKKKVTYNGWFDHSHRVGADTKVFFIPSNISNKDGFSVYTGTKNLFKSNTLEYSVSYMKNKDSGYSEYVLGFLGGDSGSYDSNNVFFVESVSSTLDSDDEIVQTISGKWGGVDSEFLIDKSLGVLDIDSGDVLRLGLDESKTVISLNKVMDYDRMSLGQSGGPGVEYGHYIGYAYDFMDTTLRICYKDPATLTLTTELQNIWADSVGNVYVYDSDTKKFTSTSYSAVKTYETHGGAYSLIFAQMRYSTIKTMVIYK